MKANLTNYHSHCSFCDGRAPLEDFVREAIRQGFSSYGVSSHAPLPFSTHWSMDYSDIPDYLEEFQTIREKYKERIELYVGLEIDYLNEESHPAVPLFRDLPLDYRIGSVHLLYDNRGEVVDIDCNPQRFAEIVDNHFSGDLDRVIRLYYERYLRLMEFGAFDILGHADKMHYNASCYRPGLLDEPGYIRFMDNYIDTIARKGYLLEINTKAWQKLGTFFPNQRYFRKIREAGIPVVVNSDAHYPELINAGRYDALMALKEAGYTHVMELHQGIWKEMPVNI